MKKHTFDVFGYKFSVSVSRIKSFGSQAAHFGAHFLIAVFYPRVSLGLALGFEVRDGEQGHLENWKEGFNIYPDFLFRMAGVLGGYFARLIIIQIFINQWR